MKSKAIKVLSSKNFATLLDPDVSFWVYDFKIINRKKNVMISQDGFVRNVEINEDSLLHNRVTFEVMATLITWNYLL